MSSFFYRVCLVLCAVMLLACATGRAQSIVLGQPANVTGKVGTYVCQNSQSFSTIQTIPVGRPVPGYCKLVGTYHAPQNFASGAPPYNGWMAVNVDSTDWIYIERDTIKKENNIVHYWVLDEYKGAIRYDNFGNARSLESRYVMYCDSHMLQPLSETGYSARGAAGQVVFTKGAGPMRPVRGGPPEAIERVVCH